MNETAVNRFDLYDNIRVAMAALWPVDSFVVGLLRDDNVIVFPYSFDDGRPLRPDFHTYGTEGFTSWLLRNKKTYSFRMDNGKLLHKGYRFGNVRRPSRDAVISPLLDRTGAEPSVLGSVAMYSYRPHVFDNQAVAALEWFSARLADRLLERTPHQLTTEPSSTTYSSLLVDLIGTFTNDLQKIIDSVDSVDACEPADVDLLRPRLREFQALCRDVSVRAVELIASRGVDAARAMNLLTPREKTIAALIAHGLSNREIARGLQISEATVKTHTSRILKKFNARQRSEIAARVFPMVQFGGAFNLLDQD